MYNTALDNEKLQKNKSYSHKTICYLGIQEGFFLPADKKIQPDNTVIYMINGLKVKGNPAENSD